MTVAREIRRLVALRNQLIVAGYALESQVQTFLDGGVVQPAVEAGEVLRGLVRDAPLGEKARQGCREMGRTVCGVLVARDGLRGFVLGPLDVELARLHRHDAVLKALQTAFPEVV
jgi:hypothetical protein